MIDEGVRALLLAQAGVTALCPAQTIERNTVNAIFVNAPVQGVKPPFVVITMIGGDPYLTLDSTYHEGLRDVELDIDTFSYSSYAAATLDKTIRQFLDDYTGAAGSNDTVAAVRHEHQLTGYDYPAEGFDTKFHYVSTTYRIQYTQV